ncbi:MAG: response regulator [Deltaproteobacteria bacterium]|nr:response regulator [Deltaproteobacteria bacterium]
MENIENKKAKILVVDDDEHLRNLTETLCLKLGYEVITVNDGSVALEIVPEDMPDLILMDIMMPMTNGFEATEKLKANPKTKHIPIIVLSALDNRDDRLEGIRRGANDYLIKPFDVDELSLRIKNNLKVKSYYDILSGQKEVLEVAVAQRTEELKKSYVDTIERLNLAAEYKDKETGAHIKRIGLLARKLAEAMGLDSDFVENIYYAAPMHDIGKVAVPDAILLKEGPLSDEEFDVVKTHPEVGAKILEGSSSPVLKMAEEIALTHHEKWSGRGYPRGLKGEEIPLSGRIVNLVDQYDAMRSVRPYKTVLHHSTVVNVLTEGDGKTSPDDFDPDVLEAFKKANEKFNDIYGTERHYLKTDES